jgi:transcriptional regulator with XRE-family HTH domain
VRQGLKNEPGCFYKRLKTAGRRIHPMMATRPPIERNDSSKAIAERMRLTRIAYGRTQGRARAISQKVFCDLVDLSQQLWNNVERGSARLGLNSAIKIVERIGVTLDWIYLGRRDGLPAKLAAEISKLEKEDRKVDRDWLDLAK